MIEYYIRHQETILMVVFPVFIFFEFRRAWKILYKGEVAFYTGIATMLAALHLLGFNKVSDSLTARMSQPDYQKNAGRIGFVVGSLLSVGWVVNLSIWD